MRIPEVKILSDFFRGKGFKVIVAVFVLIFGIMIASVVHNGVAGTVDGFIGVVVTPIRQAANAVGGFFSSIGDNFESRKKLQDEVASLTDQLNELTGRIAEYDELKRENEQLRELVKLREEVKDMQFVYAAVISRGNDPWNKTIGLDKGSLDGVKQGDPVITKDKFLVGYVSKVGPTWCTVTTILDITTSIGVRLSSSREVGVAECPVELSERGMCEVDYLPRDTATARGELVLTSGLSGSYPEGLILGAVSALELSDDGLSTIATVTPSADINAVRDVFIITDFAK